MTNKKERITWVDMARGYGILIVILAHIHVGGVLESWAYSFHMPLFFLLSGYCFSAKEGLGPFLKKKCMKFLIPYFGLGIPMVLFDWWWYRQSVPAFRRTALLKQSFIDLFVQKRLWTIWFLACLFLLNIIFYLTVRVLKTEGKLLIAAIVSTAAGLLYYKNGGQPLPWNLDVCMMAYPFFFVGYWYKNHHEKIDAYIDGKKISVLYAVLAVGINILGNQLSIRLSGSGLEMWGSRYGIALLTLPAAYAGIAAVILVSKWCTYQPVRYIGENSLLYFMWHQTIMMPLTEKWLKMVHFTLNTHSSAVKILMHSLTETILIVAVLTLCNWLLDKSVLRVILGKFPAKDKKIR